MNFKDWAQALQSVVTILALFGGLFWFIARRQYAARANLSHVIGHGELDKDRLWVRLKIVVENRGEVMISITNIMIEIRQIIPDLVDASICKVEDASWKAQPIQWHLLCRVNEDLNIGEKPIDPGEVDEITTDFVIKSDVEVISITTHVSAIVHDILLNPKVDYSFKPPEDGRLGWTNVSTYKF